MNTESKTTLGNKLCTSVEQSKQLIALGLDVNTADMFWSYHEKWYSEGDEWEGFEDYPRAEPYNTYTRKDKEWEQDKSDIPSWSIFALFELMPNNIVETDNDRPIIEKIEKNLYACKYLDIDEKRVFIRKYGTTPIDVMFKMMCHLLKKHFIKK